MIVVDTDVLSELMKAAPEPAVARWTAAQPSRSIYTTTITQAEILHGILLLAPGRKRDAIQVSADAMFAMEFEGRILAFDSAAAIAYARIAVDRRRAGRPISHFDAQIAAIACAENCTLATRNTAGFEGCGVRVVNPWSAASS